MKGRLQLRHLPDPHAAPGLTARRRARYLELPRGPPPFRVPRPGRKLVEHNSGGDVYLAYYLILTLRLEARGWGASFFKKPTYLPFFLPMFT